MRLAHLAVFILQDVGPAAVQDADRAFLKGRGVLVGIQSAAGCLHPDQTNLLVVKER